MGEAARRPWPSGALLLALALLIAFMALLGASGPRMDGEPEFRLVPNSPSKNRILSVRRSAGWTVDLQLGSPRARLDTSLPWHEGWLCSEGSPFEREGMLSLAFEGEGARRLHLGLDYAPLTRRSLRSLLLLFLLAWLAGSCLPSLPEGARKLLGWLRGHRLFPILLACTMVALVMWYPTMLGGGVTGYGLQSEGNVRLALINVFDHGQLPAWSPYVAGGYRFGGHPECHFPSPFLLPPAFFGPRRGILVNLLSLLLLSAWGFWCLSGLLPLSTMARSIALLAFLTQGILGPLAAERELVNALPLLFPALLYCCLAPSRRAPWIGAVLVAWFLVDGRLHALSNLLAVGLCLLAWSPFGERGRRLATLGKKLGRLLFMCALGTLLALPKLLLLVELLGTESYGHASWSDVGGSFPAMLMPPWLMASSTLVAIGSTALPLGLALVALVKLRRASAPWAWAWLGLMLLGCGARGPLPIWRFLHALPLMGSIRNAAKYFGPPTALCLCILAALGLEAVWRSLRPRRHLARGIIFLLALAWIVPRLSLARLGAVVLPRASHGSPEPASSFHAVEGDPAWRKWMSGAPYSCDQLFASGRGVLDWHGPLVTPCHAQARYRIRSPLRWLPNPDYRGEAFFECEEEGKVQITAFSPLAVDLTATVDRPGRLVLNQNFHEQWRCDGGAVESWKGLVSVRLTRKGRHDLHLRFDPWKSRRALMLSACLFLFVLIRIFGTKASPSAGEQADED